MTDERDGQVYKIVTIGTQTWMAENLNYAYLQKTAEEDSSSFCYNNETDSCATYGRLYRWSAAMDSAAIFSDAGRDCCYGVECSAAEPVRGVCPEGWHLPSRDEWVTLFNAVGGNDIAGRMLKSTSGWHYDGNGIDSYSFSVLPAGSRDSPMYFYAGDHTYFWSSTEYGDLSVSCWETFYGSASVLFNGQFKRYAHSIRCLKDSN